MKWLKFSQENAEQFADMELEQLLIYMLRFGKPRVSFASTGWYCKVEMNTNSKGTQFDVSSEFGHPTPSSAARECHERVVNAMKTLTS